MKYKILSVFASILVLFGAFIWVGSVNIIKANEDYKQLEDDVKKQHYISDCSEVDVELTNLQSIDYNEKVGQCSKLSTLSGFTKYIDCIKDKELSDKLHKKYNKDFFNSGKCITILCTGYEDTEINKVSSIEVADKTWTITKEIGNVGVNIQDKGINTVMYIMEHNNKDNVPLEYNITYKTSDVNEFSERLQKIKISEQFWTLGKRLPYKSNIK